jgi:hypothetical protein
MKRPASQYYWGNWLADTALQSCSLAARGLWHEMNCHMHQSEPYGHLYVNGKPVSAEKLANLCRISANTCRKLLSELEDAGVFSRDENSAIFSRRMVRDEAAREKAAEAGRANGNKGAEYGHLGAEHGAKGGRPRKTEGGVISEPEETPPETPLNPPSSSASASATAVNEDKLSLVCAQPAAEHGDEGGEADLLGHQVNGHRGPPECPHIEVLGLWAEVMPDQVQHDRERWKGKRADHLRARWRETAVAKGWASQAEGIAYMRKFFMWCRRSPFLMGKVPPRPGHRQFELELAWLVNPENWTKTHEGKYHSEG